MLCILIRWVRSAFHRLPTNWSRVGSSLGRLSQYISAHSAHTWNLLVADDFHLEVGGAGYREALMIFFVLCHMAGAPLSWSKTSRRGHCHMGRFRNTPSLILSRRIGKEGRMVCEMVGNHCFCRLRQYGLLRGRKGCLCSRCARVRAPISCTSLSLPHSSSSRHHEESSSICVLYTP